MPVPLVPVLGAWVAKGRVLLDEVELRLDESVELSVDDVLEPAVVPLATVLEAVDFPAYEVAAA